MLDINIDGIPLFRKAKSKLMPILAWFEGSDPFILGAYYGRTDPDNATEFLEDLVNELQAIFFILLNWNILA